MKTHQTFMSTMLARPTPANQGASLTIQLQSDVRTSSDSCQYLSLIAATERVPACLSQLHLNS